MVVLNRRVQRILLATTEEEKRGCLVVADNLRARLQFVSSDIVRVRVHFEDGAGAERAGAERSAEQLWSEGMPERSYALVQTGWKDELDALLKDERQHIDLYEPQVSEDSPERLTLETATMKVVVHKAPLYFSLVDKESGREIYSDLPTRAFERDHLGRSLHYSRIDPKYDHFFGFGETTGYLDKKGRHMRLCSRDAIGHDPEFCEAMYKHIPFYVRVDERTGHYVGLFYNNSNEAVFDMGNERSGYWEPYSFYRTDAGDIDLFLINGPSLKDVIRRFTDLTGKSAMPTLQSLGFTMSTMYYAELEKDCDREIYSVLTQMRASGIPVDNFWLASGYSADEKTHLRYTFNWNHERFPEPREFFAKLNAQGINVIPNLKPGVLMHHPYVDYYLERGALVKEPHTQPNPVPNQEELAANQPLATELQNKEDYYIGKWWGGDGYFVDFTNPQGRMAWSHLLQENILKMGTKTVWNDNCEFDGVSDLTTVVSAEGKGGLMVEYKAIQANMMAYTAKEAIAKVYPNERPYIINRAGYTGIQRYAQVWGGDNLTDWRTLKFNVATIIGMGLSGVANMGCDIGGFAGEAPEPELLLRWVQNGVFQPRFTMNSANSDNTVTQPFMYPEYIEEIKAAFALRYHYMVYLYSLMRVAHLEGLPVWRPLFMEFPEDQNCLSDRSLSFMFGPSLLIATVLEKGQKERPIYLPAGHKWYDLNDNFKVYEGGQTINYKVEARTIPMFLRDNAIVVASDDLHRLVFDKVETLQLLIAATATKDQQDTTHSTENLSFDYYEDDGHSLDFQAGGYANTTISVTSGERTLIHFKKTGKLEHSYQKLYLKVVSKEKGALYVKCADTTLKRFLVPDDFAQAESGWYYNMSERVIEIKCQKPQPADDFTIEVSTKHFDLIGMENNG